MCHLTCTLRIFVTVAVLVAQLGIVALLAVDSFDRYGLGAATARWFVAAPLVLYSLASVPACLYRPSATWRGFVHGAAAVYATALAVLVYAVAEALCIDEEQGDTTPALLRQSEMRRFAQQVVTVSGLYLLTGTTRALYECIHVRLEREDTELALLEEHVRLESDTTAARRPPRRRRKRDDNDDLMLGDVEMRERRHVVVVGLAASSGDENADDDASTRLGS